MPYYLHTEYTGFRCCCYRISREFDLSFAPAGLYLLEVNVDGERMLKNVVKK